jgi:hypothetical protein
VSDSCASFTWQGPAAVVMVYDLTEAESFARLRRDYEAVFKPGMREDIPVALVGNKVDLFEEGHFRATPLVRPPSNPLRKYGVTNILMICEYGVLMRFRASLLVSPWSKPLPDYWVLDINIVIASIACRCLGTWSRAGGGVGVGGGGASHLLRDVGQDGLPRARVHTGAAARRGHA